jgi:hypothetical protein
MADEMLSGALVVATDVFGNITDWTISDATGNPIVLESIGARNLYRQSR